MAENEKKVEIYNLTPHAVKFVSEDGKTTEFPPTSVVARVSVSYEEVESIGGFRAVKIKYGRVNELPDEKENIYYIVSKLVKLAMPERKDLITPEDVVRDEQGHVLYCRAWEI